MKQIVERMLEWILARTMLAKYFLKHLSGSFMPFYHQNSKGNNITITRNWRDDLIDRLKRPMGLTAKEKKDVQVSNSFLIKIFIQHINISSIYIQYEFDRI